MKSPFAFLALLLLFSFANPNYARKGPEDYWKKIMKDQPVPDAIKNLLVKDTASQSDANRKIHLVKDFDTKSNAIIYHSHGSVDKKKEEHPLLERAQP